MACASLKVQVALARLPDLNEVASGRAKQAAATMIRRSVEQTIAAAKIDGLPSPAAHAKGRQR